MKPFVLVVEDDDDVRETLELILKSGGYEVLTAADGLDAMAILRGHEHEVGLILLDVIMPNMDGWQFLEERSKNATLEHVPTIVLSGAHPMNPISSHATAFLMKPIAAKELLRTVSKYSNLSPDQPA
jgi:two-component system cell cycle sensor histidine kinase/response regulator CckA